jgi:hypothetical protein
MDQVIVIGNCQAKALELMLGANDAFARRFEFVSFPPVHEIPDEMVPVLHEAVERATVVVAQRVGEEYRDGIGLGTETLARLAGTATVVRWPSVFWAGYVPDLFYLRDAERQPVVDGPFDYHDRTILQAYADGADVAGTCALLADPERPSDAAERAAGATAELETRGHGCDVEVTAFIAERFREQLLFYTMNHPANRLLGHLAQQIAELLGVPGGIDHHRLPDEVLGSTYYPLHANHVRALELGFGAGFAAGSAAFRIRGVTSEPDTAIRAFFDYYAEHPQLVALNLNPHFA